MPLKMLPFDNKNELLLVLDFDEGTTLERSDAAVREIEEYLGGLGETGERRVRFVSEMVQAGSIAILGSRPFYALRGRYEGSLPENLCS